MNLKDLKYLVALADTGHFGKAAERTFVSQPTLSAQLKKLEEYLGVKLVERQPKNVQLTEVGKQVVVRARRMLNEGDEIVALARNNTDPFAGKLKMALIPTIGPYLLPRVMPKLRKALPNLSLMLYEYQTEALLKRLRDGEIDLGHHGAARRAGRHRVARALRGGFHRCAAEQSCARRQIDHQGAGSERAYAAAAGGRPLPARPGAGSLQPGRCPRGRGFSRDQSRDPAANGGRGSRHHLAAGTRGGVAVRLAARPHGAPIRQAGTVPHRRRGVAQVEHAHSAIAAAATSWTRHVGKSAGTHDGATPAAAA